MVDASELDTKALSIGNSEQDLGGYSMLRAGRKSVMLWWILLVLALVALVLLIVRMRRPGA